MQQKAIFEEIRYANPARPALGIEVMRLSHLFRRASIEHFRDPQRPQFHLLLLVTAGRGSHLIDFCRHACLPGTVLHVRSGQVQRYMPERGFEAIVVLFSAASVMPHESVTRASGRDSLIDHVLPAGSARLSGISLAKTRRDFQQLAAEYGALCGAAHESQILQHRLNLLLLRLAHVDIQGQGGSSSSHSAATRMVARFERELELRFLESHRVADFARWLGCGPKTLYSSCMALRGVGPKMLIERRLVLEAKRLLVYTPLTSERISADLGFSEPANFTRLFRQVAGVSPGRFRAQQQANVS